MDPYSTAAILDEPVRRGLYEYVRRERRPVTRDEAAHAQRISVKLAAFHLEKLVAAGLLEADDQLPAGVRRRVGRAPKRYACAPVEVTLSLPARRYDLFAEILLDTLVSAEANPDATSTRALAEEVARERGRQQGAALNVELSLGRPGPERSIAAIEGLLGDLGFEPHFDGTGDLVLANCPFHALMERSPELVCAINAAFLDGMLRGLGNESVRAELVPSTERCCVCLRTPSRSAPTDANAP